MRVVALSDTHGFHHDLKIPDGDLLIHAGDFSMKATVDDVIEFSQWFNALPHKHKIIVAGNHDQYCEDDPLFCDVEFRPAIYLNHESCEVMGYKIFGSPYSSSIYEPSPWSFDYPRNGPLSQYLWAQIPDHLDVLITHGPPKGILDLVNDPHVDEDLHVGDMNLLNEVMNKLPRVHIVGHIHEGAGHYDGVVTRFYNVCICDVRYNPTNPVTLIDI